MKVILIWIGVAEHVGDFPVAAQGFSGFDLVLHIFVEFFVTDVCSGYRNLEQNELVGVNVLEIILLLLLDSLFKVANGVVIFQFNRKDVVCIDSIRLDQAKKFQGVWICKER